MKKFGCTTPFGFMFGQKNILENICTNNKTGIKALELFDNLSSERYFIDECLYPCKFIKIALTTLKGIHNTTQNHTFKMYFNQYIKVTDTQYSYTGLELLAEFGGYVGLFLGISVFHLNQVFAKIVNYLSMTCQIE